MECVWSLKKLAMFGLLHQLESMECWYKQKTAANDTLWASVIRTLPPL